MAAAAGRAWVETLLEELGGFTDKEERQLLDTYDFVATHSNSSAPTSWRWLPLSEGGDLRYVMFEVLVQLKAHGYLVPGMQPTDATQALVECAPRAATTIVVHHDGDTKHEMMPLLAARFLLLVHPPFRSLQVRLSYASTEMPAQDWRVLGTGDWHDLVAHVDPEFTVYAHYLAHHPAEDTSRLAAMWEERVRNPGSGAALADETKHAATGGLAAYCDRSVFVCVHEPNEEAIAAQVPNV